MHAIDDGETVSFQLPYGEWIRLFRANGFVIEDCLEPRPGPVPRAPTARPRRWRGRVAGRPRRSGASGVDGRTRVDRRAGWRPWASTSRARSSRSRIGRGPRSCGCRRTAVTCSSRQVARPFAMRPRSSRSSRGAGPRSSLPRSPSTSSRAGCSWPTRASASASSSRRSATSPAGSTSCRCTLGSRSTWPGPRRSSWRSARPTCGWRCCPRGSRRCSTSSTPLDARRRRRCPGPAHDRRRGRSPRRARRPPAGRDAPAARCHPAGGGDVRGARRLRDRRDDPAR